MTIKELLIEADAIQVSVAESDWQIHLAASPLVAKGYISAEYGQAVIDNTLHHGAYYVFDEGVAIPHARPECGVKRNCFSLVVLNKPIQFADSEKADIVIMFGAQDIPELAQLAQRAQLMRLGPVFTVDQQHLPDIELLNEWIEIQIGNENCRPDKTR
ncbi:PTS sugar transporter subunit IIA [Salmonella enterica]|nr:PTS sugar transporter subunit IIA [Salmonella enterica]EJJ4247702.1 PTS sugar transporter subunit IIA [Salmonella enterica]ELM1620663.1 PTS sugar transporter subunit IIA [Salmonella enterica]HCL4435235.1 PTS sugar transporter subunit IIA [Salmonella enterica]HCL5082309.1 PTS sugar transporter subunit IIA [Salmonella enterica]